MTDQDLINAAIGVALPLLVAVVMRQKWPDTVRTLVAYGVYLAAALISAWFLNTLDIAGGTLRDYVRGFLVIAFTAYSSFKLAYQQMGVTPKIEEKTSPA